MSTLAFRSRSCPSRPTSGMIICRPYLWYSAAVRGHLGEGESHPAVLTKVISSRGLFRRLSDARLVCSDKEALLICACWVCRLTSTWFSVSWTWSLSLRSEASAVSTCWRSLVSRPSSGSTSGSVDGITSCWSVTKKFSSHIHVKWVLFHNGGEDRSFTPTLTLVTLFSATLLVTALHPILSFFANTDTSLYISNKLEWLCDSRKLSGLCCWYNTVNISYCAAAAWK